MALPWLGANMEEPSLAGTVAGNLSVKLVLLLSRLNLIRFPGAMCHADCSVVGWPSSLSRRKKMKTETQNVQQKCNLGMNLVTASVSGRRSFKKKRKNTSKRGMGSE